MHHELTNKEHKHAFHSNYVSLRKNNNRSQNQLLIVAHLCQPELSLTFSKPSSTLAPYSPDSKLLILYQRAICGRCLASIFFSFDNKTQLPFRKLPDILCPQSGWNVNLGSMLEHDVRNDPVYTD